MTIGQSLLPEFDQETQSTRKVLELIPDDKWDWKPHAKSGTVGWYVSHIATLPGWTTMTINTEELDYAPVGKPSFQPPKVENRKEALEVFDKEAAEARAALSKVSDEDIMKGWTLLAGGQTIFTMPRIACVGAGLTPGAYRGVAKRRHLVSSLDSSTPPKRVYPSN